MSGLICLARSRSLLLSCATRQTTCVRMMSGDPLKQGPPSHLTGGMYRHRIDVPPPPHEEITEWVKKRAGDNWESLGYNTFDPKVDREGNHLMFFLLVTLGIVLTTFVFAYSPRNHKNDWITREAYLLLREREAAGVEPISKDLVDPEKVLASLPSDEELKAAGVVLII